MALARAESDLKHLEETSENELGASLSQLLEGTETVADPSTLEEIDNKYNEVRRKIESLGPVNPEALQEFEEAQERQNVPEHAAAGSSRFDTRYREDDSRDRQRIEEALRGSLPRDQREFPCVVRCPIWWRRGRDAPHR